MNLHQVVKVRIGLVGKPNVGKSTFFSAATMAQVDIANYPFCTIDPNVGVAFCRHVSIAPARTFETNSNRKVVFLQHPIAMPVKGSLCEPRTGTCVAHRRSVPVALVDVAGLVPEPVKGEDEETHFFRIWPIATC